MKLKNKLSFSLKCSPASVLLALALLGTASLAHAQMLRITEAEAKKAAIKRVEPAFPPIARQMNLSGRVIVDLFVDVDGSVEKVDVVSGSPILAAAASSAAKSWKFQPFQASGAPTKAVLRQSFEFIR